MSDRFGLGWRVDLSAGIFAHLDCIDVLEVIADDWFDVTKSKLRALRTLASSVPVVLHGIGLGAASTVPVGQQRLSKLARLIETVRPESWSEHLAFVRGGGIEIGHLAAPPRTSATIEGTVANLDAARRIVGTCPQVENIATLIDPPGSRMDEPDWLCQTLAASGADLLLDLHNLYANSINFGHDSGEFLRRLPLHQVATVHIAGGRWITAPDAEEGRHNRRWLDDHKHDVPDPVFALLEELGSRTVQPLTVILEQDGNFPPMSHLLAQLDRARTTLAAGRARSVTATRPTESLQRVTP